ncbi:hypothetical protein CHISP_2708 [Chitinispirillum alkaliphilum]|nr:hypothetical protein CHISP_2708 [Chitinispirillum alkaliphilum]
MSVSRKFVHISSFLFFLFQFTNPGHSSAEVSQRESGLSITSSGISIHNESDNSSPKEFDSTTAVVLAISSTSGNENRSSGVLGVMSGRTAVSNQSSSGIESLLSGDRNRARPHFQNTISQNNASLRSAYIRRLREMPNLEGSMEVVFAIDQNDRIIGSEIRNSDLGVEDFDSEISQIMKSWNYESENNNKVKEIRYQFIFTHNSN